MSGSMKELVVVSGKGGTGKTSIAACLAALHKNTLSADCDVDASNLHLVLKPRILEKHEFSAGHSARIRSEQCARCGICLEVCRFEAVLSLGDGQVEIDKIACGGCGVCAHFCPEKAIDLVQTVSGEWFISKARTGPMVHARPGIAKEKSGKLVTIIRKEARKLAQEKGCSLLVVDGSPGIGCPVIASMIGADMALLVAEATISGLHDIERVADLASQLRVEAAVCINKWDLNEEVTVKIESLAEKRGMLLAGRVRYDNAVTDA
ncbi:MAG: ATP-binding protein, partial [Planctomycetota bacterium]